MAKKKQIKVTIQEEGKPPEEIKIEVDEETAERLKKAGEKGATVAVQHGFDDDDEEDPR